MRMLCQSRQIKNNDLFSQRISFDVDLIYESAIQQLYVYFETNKVFYFSICYQKIL